MEDTRTVCLGNLTVTLMSGDIARVRVDALVTAINSEGAWFGGVDGVIRRAAGGMFHSQVRLPLKHADVAIAKKRGSHRGRFGDVVFVIDDLHGPLSKVVIAGLVGADRAGYETVSLPAIRTGVMLGAVEKDAAAAAKEIFAAIKEFASRSPKSLKSVTLVIYNDKKFFGRFQERLLRS